MLAPSGVAAADNFNPRPPWGGRPEVLPKNRTQFFAFRPRPPWGGRQEQRDNYKAQADISIHALRGEGDSGLRSMTRGRMISIHALRGEGDDKLRVDQTVARKFQSTPSVGRATVKLSPPVKRSLRFQSTPSVGRATFRTKRLCDSRDISIHALRGEGDRDGLKLVCNFRRFQSTPSVGRATPKDDAHVKDGDTSIHALRGEGDVRRRN